MDKLTQAKKYLGARYVFSPNKRDEINRQKRDVLPVLLIALMARRRG
jgi:hypothetical protein